jgi:hypothetical protein
MSTFTLTLFLFIVLLEKGYSCEYEIFVWLIFFFFLIFQELCHRFIFFKKKQHIFKSKEIKKQFFTKVFYLHKVDPIEQHLHYIRQNRFIMDDERKYRILRVSTLFY